MKLTTILLSTAALAAVAVLTAATVQDKKPADGKAAVPAGADTPSKPGPEHQRLATEVGTWEATVTSYETGKPEVSKGTEVRKMVGGFWLVADFTGTMAKEPFVGHGVTGYDPMKKKYVGVWADSMMPSMATSEGTFDAATKTMTCKTKFNMMGQEVLATMTTEYKDADTQVFKMLMPGPDGKDMTTMMIEYKRKK